MKKTIALAIIAIFILSVVPYTLADEGKDDNKTDDKLSDVANRSGNSGTNIRIESKSSIKNSIKIRDLREDIKDEREDIRDALGMDRKRCLEKCKNESNQNESSKNCEARCKIADRKEDMKDLREDIRENRGKGKFKMIKVRDAAELNIRHLSSERIEIFRERFEHAKEDFKEAKEKLEESRKELKEAMKRGDNNATLNHSKEYLLHTTDVLINHLEKIKTKVQENENIPNETEARIVAEIDVQISGLNSIKDDIRAAKTRDQIKEIAKDLRKKWNDLKHLIKLYTSRVVSARVEGIVNQGLVLEKRLDKILKKFNDSGIQSNVRDEIDQFKAKIAESRDKYRQAQAKLTEAIDLRAAGEPADSDKIKALLEEANDLLKQARGVLKDAHELLKDIIKQIKQADSDADLSSETEVELEHEAEVENETDGDDDSVETNTTVQAST